MRLSILLILLVLIAMCAAKASKSKSHKTAKSKTSKAIETKKHKDAGHKDSGKKHKTSSKKHDSKKKAKTTDKTANKTIANKGVNKTEDKLSNKTVSVEPKENSTKANLLKNPPADCQKIIDEYSNGKILMYEYKIQMGRCLKKAKEGDSTADADVKSAMLRPDDSPKEDSDLAVNVKPFNEPSAENTNNDVFDEFHENDNNSDNDYSEDDDDDDDDDEPDELADKKMQVPSPLGSVQAPNVPMTESNMPAQPQQGMLGQQATAAFSPNMDQTPYSAAPAQSPAPVPQQSQAAFASVPMNQYPVNPMPEPNMAMNTVAKSDIPESAQPQAPASQANAVFDQWRASSFGAATADKKDETPSAPVVPANDQFAEFMKMQSASSSSMDAAPASQQTVVPGATQQRSDIPQRQNMFPMQIQSTNLIPGQSQAFYMQPEEIGDFPENP